MPQGWRRHTAREQAQPDAAQERRLAAAARAAQLAGQRGRLGIGQKGEAVEAARAVLHQQHNVKTTNMNRFTPKAENFPVVDVSSRRGFESAKGWSGKSAAQQAARHVWELRNIRDTPGRLKLATERVSRALPELRRQGTAPHSLRTSSSKAAIATELSKTKVVVFDDVVGDARKQVTRSALQFPGDYGIDRGKPLLPQIRELRQQIQGCGLTRGQYQLAQQTGWNPQWSKLPQSSPSGGLQGKLGNRGPAGASRTPSAAPSAAARPASVGHAAKATPNAPVRPASVGATLLGKLGARAGRAATAAAPTARGSGAATTRVAPSSPAAARGGPSPASGSAPRGSAGSGGGGAATPSAGTQPPPPPQFHMPPGGPY